MNTVTAIIRLLEGMADVFNRIKKKKYTKDTASAIANNDDTELRESAETFDNLADKAKRDKTG